MLQNSLFVLIPASYNDVSERRWTLHARHNLHVSPTHARAHANRIEIDGRPSINFSAGKRCNIIEF